MATDKETVDKTAPKRRKRNETGYPKATERQIDTEGQSSREALITNANQDLETAFAMGHDHEQVQARAEQFGTQREINAADLTREMGVQVVNEDFLRKAKETLKKYRDGKRVLEHNIVTNQKWFKKRHWDLMDNESNKGDPKPSSGWLFNTIIAKHADFADNAPMANVLPREAEDQEEAKMLQSIIPVILDETDFDEVYDDETWAKIQDGTGVFGVFWNSQKQNGLGGIEIANMDVLNLFWEPGVTDIQKSKCFFSVELVDNETLKAAYPQLAGKLKDNHDSTVQRYYYDENISTAGKSAVVDMYYKKNINGRDTVQYVKFVNDDILYATENDTAPETEMKAVGKYDEMGNPVVKEDGTYDYDLVEEVVRPSVAEVGLYDHGMYPFVFDVLYPDRGMPTGFGLIHVCKSTQASIDIMNNCLEKNMQHVCNPRYVMRNDGGINEKEFCDPNKLLVHSDGNLGNDTFAPINVPQMVSGNYITLMQEKVNEMKETSGNRDVLNGGTTGGATAASAVAAMQESAGKLSRDMVKTTYRAYKEVVYMVIELVRQFYNLPRQFRITDEYGQQQFVSYDNSRIKPQHMGYDFGIDQGYRKPEFSLKVEAEKQSPYTRMSQNELALQLYNNGMFNPQLTDQALVTLGMMDFQGKNDIIQQVRANGTMYERMVMMEQQMLKMSQIIDAQNGSNLSEELAMKVDGETQQLMDQPQQAADLHTTESRESKITDKARAKAAETTQVR